MSGIKTKFSFQLLYAFSQLIFPLISYPYITRTLGAAGLGLVGYVEYVSGFIIAIASFGIPFYGVREAAKLQNNLPGQQLLFRQLFLIHVLVSIIGLAVFAGIINFSRQVIPLPLFALGCINIMLPPFIAEWYMQGIEAFKFTTIRNIVLRALGLAAIFIFVASTPDYVIYYGIIILVQLAVAVTNLYRINAFQQSKDVAGIRRHVKPLLHFFLTASIISIYVFFDVIILGMAADEKSVGYYTVAIKIIKLSLLLVLALNVILFPRISQLTSVMDLAVIRSLIDKVLSFIILLTLPITVGFYFLAPQIIQLVAGAAFLPAIPLMRLLCAVPFVIGLSNLFVYQILVPFEKEKKMLLAVFITCICSLGLHVTLVNLFEEKGTAVATIFTEVIMLVLTYYFSFKTFHFNFPVRLLLQSIAALGPFVSLVLIAQYVAAPPIWIVCIAVPGIILYGLLHLFLFKNTLLREALTSLRWRRKLRVSNG